jgi:DNA gyrase/topoisomerase IV subunit A
MEDAFSINAVALVDGKPLTLGLKDLLQVFINHRVEVVTRRY